LDTLGSEDDDGRPSFVRVKAKTLEAPPMDIHLRRQEREADD